MQIIGLKLTGKINVPALRKRDLVVSYQTYSIGDGEWSIEAKTSNDQSVWGPSIEEWVGSNGTREEADDLWEQVRQWQNDPDGGLMVIRPSYSYKEYVAPDGCSGPYSFFKKEIEKGRLHGLVACF